MAIEQPFITWASKKKAMLQGKCKIIYKLVNLYKF